LNIINIATTFLLFSFLSYHFIDSAHQVEQELKLVNRKLQRLATTDSLTNMFNRRTMIEYIEAEIKHYEHVGVPFALILCDIDDFKSFNDQYGHECGDFVLVTASELMMELLRAQDRLARWGGEEFLILLPLTTTEGAVSVAARIREELLNRAFQFYGQQLKITMTYGVTLYLPGNSVRECINRADRALLQGKERGKNRIILEDGSQNLVELQLDPVLD
jgi:diguanylate cyclase (GGDEF)-like protein